MVNRIDIFMPPLSQYGALQYMTQDIYEAMQNVGIKCRLLVAQHDNPQPFLESIFSDPPDCTFSLNGLLPDSEGRFFCDMIKIPHIAALVDSQNQFVSLTQSPLNIITCPDAFECEFFKGLKFENVLFFPHGVSSKVTPSQEEKTYDVLFLGSCIDYETIRQSWKERYPERLTKALNEAAEIALSDQTTSYVNAFVEALNNNISKEEPLDPAKTELMLLLDDLEMYIRGRDRVELIRGIKDADVHVVGAGKLGSGWSKYLKDQKNVTLHEPVPFENALGLMKRSKIVLNSCPWIKCGGHERVFAAMASGALAITAENPYMSNHFENGKDLAFYHYNRWEEMNDLVNGYLKDDAKRNGIIESGRKKVMENHTWDSRVKTLLSELPPILKEIKEKIS